MYHFLAVQVDLATLQAALDRAPRRTVAVVAAVDGVHLVVARAQQVQVVVEELFS
jgi:intracellular sulfur oxidation DsrE/DsrF family protein